VLCIGLWQYQRYRIVTVHYLDLEERSQELSMPQIDKKRLAYLMKKLFANDSFAYVLLGKKPMGTTVYLIPFAQDNLSDFSYSLSNYNLDMYLAWKTWLKYRHHFPNVLFWDENCENSPGLRCIVLVNEKNLDQVIKENLASYQKVLKRDKIDAKSLLEEAKHRPFISNLLKGHWALLGISLGYGSNNAWLFHHKASNYEILPSIWEHELWVNWSKEALEIADTEEEYLLRVYSCPSFVGDPNSEETKKLKQDFLDTRERVLVYFGKEDFLERCLSLLTGYRQ